MKTFYQKYRGTLIPLFMLIIALILIWNINIYKAWWIYFTPWEKFGTPSAKAEEILRIEFPTFYDEKFPRPRVYVSAEDNGIYHLNGLSQWSPGEFTYFDLSDYHEEEKFQCARTIEQEWKLNEERLRDAKNALIQGECAKHISHQYAIYQIKRDGSLWGKYINVEIPDKFRKDFSVYVSLAIIYFGLAWVIDKKSAKNIKPIR